MQYEARAKQDKARYEQDMKSYKPSGDAGKKSTPKKKAPAKKKPEPEEEDEEEEDDE